VKRTFLYISTCLLLPLLAPCAEGATRLLTSQPSPYLGQEIELSLEVRQPAAAPALRVQWPEMHGLAVEARLPSTVRRRENARGEVVEYLSRLVRPLRTGQLMLGRIPGRTLQLTVRPLPVTGRPADFSGMVGRLAYRLEDPTGTGRREVILTLEGDADLSLAGTPLAAPEGDHLTLLDTRLDNKGRSLVSRQRYLYVPADDGPGLLQVKLNWFDPYTGRYCRVGNEAPASPLRWLTLPALLTLLLAGILFKRRRTEKKIALRWIAEEGCRGSRDMRLAHLAATGCPEKTLLQLQAYWRVRDHRFSAGSGQLPPPPPRDLVRSLRKAIGEIDKCRSFRQ